MGWLDSLSNGSGIFLVFGGNINSESIHYYEEHHQRKTKSGNVNVRTLCIALIHLLLEDY